MNMLHLPLPRETETGSAGEQPAEGYRGQAHQTMRGRGATHGSSPVIHSSDDRPVMPSKTHQNPLQTRVQGTGRATAARPPHW
jgi:hypothetical protein